MGKSTISVAMFNRYVKSPKGTLQQMVPFASNPPSLEEISETPMDWRGIHGFVGEENGKQIVHLVFAGESRSFGRSPFDSTCVEDLE